VLFGAEETRLLATVRQLPEHRSVYDHLTHHWNKITSSCTIPGMGMQLPENKKRFQNFGILLYNGIETFEPVASESPMLEDQVSFIDHQLDHVPHDIHSVRWQCSCCGS
jgi:hypothetical protein